MAFARACSPRSSKWGHNRHIVFTHPGKNCQGEDYDKLEPTISISFLNHVLFPSVPDYHLRFRLHEESHRVLLTGGVEFHLLELPKFKKLPEDSTIGPDIWLYFLRNAEKMDTEALPPGMHQQPLIPRALEELAMLSKNDLERERYEARRKAQLDYNTIMKAARLEGRAQGVEEGKAEGRAEGKAEGRAEGLVRGEKIGMIHISERLLNRPQTPSEQLAGLSLDELTRLAGELQTLVENDKARLACRLANVNEEGNDYAMRSVTLIVSVGAVSPMT